MTAGKHHAELVILDLLFKDRRFSRYILLELQKVDEFRGEVAELIIPPHEIYGPVACYPHEPGRGIIRNTVNRPRFQCPAKCVLNYIFGQVEAAQAENPG